MHIGVVGGGHMGQEVFDIFARNGHQVTLYVRREAAARELDESLLGPLRKRVARGGSRAAAAEAQLKVLKITCDLNDLASCELINENIAEELSVKLDLFRRLDAICPSSTLFTSDSSFYTPDAYSEGVGHPERILGLHFFYPTRLTSFVEVIPAPATSAENTERVMELVRSLKVRPILCRNVKGFLVNRMIPAYYLEGLLMLEEGYFTAAEIDGVVKGSLANLGPLESCDMIGLDIVQKGNEAAPEIWREGHLVPPLLGELIALKRFGAKEKLGVYAYPEGKPIDDTASLPTTSRHHCVEAYSRQDIHDRLYYTMVVEAFRQLDMEVGTEKEIDATLSEILGFNPGPLASARALGLEKVRARLEDLTARFGVRFTPRGSLAG